MNIMGNLCIITARGGSKRIPRKNIKPFLGKPIIAYSIEAALDSELFDEVMVSTDDLEIKETAEQYGAKVPFLRSEKNADDYATTFDVIQEVVDIYEKKYGLSFASVCCLYPTAPFVSAKKLKEAHKLLNRGNFDSVLPVMRYGFPIQRALRRDTHGNIKFLDIDHINTRSQDLVPSYHDAGQFYWLTQTCISRGVLITENSGGLEISEMEGQDIDNEVDWKLAELKYGLL